MYSELVQLRILLEIAFDITQDTRNVGKKLGIAFDAIDVDESPCRLEVPLDAGEVEQAAEGLSVAAHLSMHRQPLEVAVYQTVNQRLIEFDIGIAQQRGEIVRDRPHQRVLKIDNPQSFAINHQIA